MGTFLGFFCSPSVRPLAGTMMRHSCNVQFVVGHEPIASSSTGVSRFFFTHCVLMEFLPFFRHRWRCFAICGADFSCISFFLKGSFPLKHISFFYVLVFIWEIPLVPSVARGRESFLVTPRLFSRRPTQVPPSCFFPWW